MLQNFRDIQSWTYLSGPTAAEGHNSDRGSGFRAYTLRLNLYMCQWLWFNRVTAQLAPNKRSTMLPCFSLLFDMTPGLLTCQGGGTDAKWVVENIIALLEMSSVGSNQLFHFSSIIQSKTSVHWPTQHVTWDKVLTRIQGRRFTPCFCCSDWANPAIWMDLSGEYIHRVVPTS